MISNEFFENVLQAAAGIAELTIDFALDVTQDVFQLADELLHLDEEGYQSPFANRNESPDETAEDSDMTSFIEERDIDSDDNEMEYDDCDNEEEQV